MIRVTIEILPAGFEKNKKPMHVIEIWNDLHDTVKNANYGSYGYRVSRKIVGGKKLSWIKEGSIYRFPRSRQNSVHLLRAVLNDAYGEEKSSEQ